MCSTTAFFLERIDSVPREHLLTERLSYLPSGQYLRFASLEFKDAVADILWLRAVQFMGGSTERGYPWFYHVIDRITELDPTFKDAYKTGAVTLSVLSHYPDLSIRLLKKGMRHLPQEWELPFYIGFNYLHHKKEPLTAAAYMEKAANLEGRPPYLPLVTARLYNKGGDTETAILFLKGIYSTTNDATMRAKIAEKIAEMERGEELKPVAPMQ